MTTIETFKVGSRFRPTRVLGRRSYGVVCRAERTSPYESTPCAIKKIDGLFRTIGDARRVLREMRAMRTLAHTNILPLTEVLQPPEGLLEFHELYLVSPLMDSDLRKIMQYNVLSEKHVQFIMFEVLCGLQYMHSAGVLHRDIKPANLLVNQDCHLIIGDLGMSRAGFGEDVQCDVDAVPSEYVTARWYRAPEVVLSAVEYGPAIDVWAAGCVFAEMVLRKPLFPGTDPINQLTRIMNLVPVEKVPECVSTRPGGKYLADVLARTTKVIDKNSLRQRFEGLQLSDDFHDLLCQMLEFDAVKRITARQALAHPFFRELYCATDPDVQPCPTLVCPLSVEVETTTDEAVIRKHLWDEIEMSQRKPDAVSVAEA